MRADYTQAYINRGDVLIKLNRTQEARRVYETALTYDRHNPDIYYNVSEGGGDAGMFVGWVRVLSVGVV